MSDPYHTYYGAPGNFSAGFWGNLLKPKADGKPKLGQKIKTTLSGKEGKGLLGKQGLLLSTGKSVREGVKKVGQETTEAGKGATTALTTLATKRATRATTSLVKDAGVDLGDVLDANTLESLTDEELDTLEARLDQQDAADAEAAGIYIGAPEGLEGAPTLLRRARAQMDSRGALDPKTIQALRSLYVEARGALTDTQDPEEADWLADIMVETRTLIMESGRSSVAGFADDYGRTRSLPYSRLAFEADTFAAAPISMGSLGRSNKRRVGLAPSGGGETGTWGPRVPGGSQLPNPEYGPMARMAGFARKYGTAVGTPSAELKKGERVLSGQRLVLFKK